MVHHLRHRYLTLKRRPAPLPEILPKPVRVDGDNSWKDLGRGFAEDTKGFLKMYVSRLLVDASAFQDGKRPGRVIFFVGENYDFYPILDAALPVSQPFVVYGVLVYNSYRLCFYKWERHPDMRVTRDVAERVFSLNNPREIRLYIGPIIRAIALEVGMKGGIKVLEVGVDCKHTDMREIRSKPNWMDYPQFVA